MILIAEDEFLIAMDISARVAGLGLTVMGPVSTVAEGLRLLDREHPAAAILDLNLRDGLVTPLALRLRARGVPFILATANDRVSFPTELASAVNIGKPVTDLRLRTAISVILSAT